MELFFKARLGQSKDDVTSFVDNSSEKKEVILFSQDTVENERVDTRRD